MVCIKFKHKTSGVGTFFAGGFHNHPVKVLGRVTIRMQKIKNFALGCPCARIHLFGPPFFGRQYVDGGIFLQEVTGAIGTAAINNNDFFDEPSGILSEIMK